MSFGIATIISDVNIKDSKELIALADKALYTAKNQGRNKSIQLDFN
jgi:PleD family two-component response regulator